jgi:hypothetical protein
MRSQLLCVTTLLIVLFVSCKKDKGDQPTKPNTPDTFSVRLKDMIVDRLPSPYFHFEYNDSGYITLANWQSGLRIYDLNYSGRKLTQLQNLIEPVLDRLEYKYKSGRVTEVHILNRNNALYRKIFISYTPSDKLQKINWEVLDNGGFSPEQMLTFTYHPDGNLKELTNTTFNAGPLTARTFTELYDDYDDKINADGFSLLLPLPQNHLVLLPNYKLQLNNPRRVVRTGSGQDYSVDYAYTYDSNGRPISKIGDVLFTTGQFKDQRFNSVTSFSWY